MFKQLIQESQVPGFSMAVLQNGRLAWHQAYGVTAADTGEPLRTEHLLAACSMSKTVTAMTVMVLAQAGALALDADVRTYQQSWRFPPDAPAVSLRLLLSHQAGLIDPPDGFGDGPAAAAGLLGRFGVCPQAAPGARFEYSDAGYMVVQALLEDVAGEPFPGLARRLVLAPLGMERSRFEMPLLPERAAEAAAGHDPNGAVMAGRRPAWADLAAGGLWSTPAELALLVGELLRPGRVLTPESVRTMTTPTGAPYAGLGCFAQRERLHHLGWGPGFQAMWFAYPAAGAGAVLMMNINPGVHQEESLIGAVRRKLVAEYGWE